MTQSKGQYVQYGCGSVAPEGWKNFDTSPTLRIQRIPVIGMLVKSKLPVIFPDGVTYGDIALGLPGIAPNSCDAVYCSHVLEHLSLDDFRSALKNTYTILKPGGLFRSLVPDLEAAANWYLNSLKEGDEKASIKFIGVNTMLGAEYNPKSITGKIKEMFGNSHHRWMWDHYSLKYELKNAGFKEIRKCEFNDSKDEMFKLVESHERFESAVAYECTK